MRLQVILQLSFELRDLPQVVFPASFLLNFHYLLELLLEIRPQVS